MNPLLYFTYPISGILCILLPIGIGVFLTRRYRLGWRLFFIGGGIFILSQVFHIPFNAGVTYLFREGILPVPDEQWLPVFNAVFLGLSAGVFEETARYLGYRYWAKDARSWSKGLLYGTGHGGAESIIVGALILISYLVMVALRGSDLGSMISGDQLDQFRIQQDAYWSLAWYDSLIGFVERAFTLPVQIGLSILVLQVFLRSQIRWLWLAIFWHALIDATVVFALNYLNVYLIEGIVAVFGLASLGIIFLLRQEEPEENVDEPPHVPVLPDTIDLPPIEETGTKLEDTRYSNSL
jgi:uncharacterized membrane protein YhfC